MSSAMDDNGILVLTNGERIPIPKQVANYLQIITLLLHYLTDLLRIWYLKYILTSQWNITII